MKRCNVCGFNRDRLDFTTRPLPNGKRLTMCRQCAQTNDLYARLDRERAASSVKATEESRPGA